MARRGPDFRYLRQLIECSLRAHDEFGRDVQVEGKIRRIGEGLFHDNYWFWINSRQTSAEWTQRTFVLRLIDRRREWNEGAEPVERLKREAETLRRLRQVDFPWPVPEFVCFVHEDEVEPLGMIETAVAGIAMDGPQFNKEETLWTIGRVAADVHRLSVEQFMHLPNKGDRRAYAADQLSELPGELFELFPAAVAARQWIESHLPPADPSRILHGDLLPQNLVFDWEQTEPGEREIVGVVDWEMAKLGDPAWDLAIVTRGSRKVCGVRGGLRVLVNAYRDAGGCPITEADVRCYEILLALHWLDEAWREYQKPNPRGHGPGHCEQQLRSLLRRVSK